MDQYNLRRVASMVARHASGTGRTPSGLGKKVFTDQGHRLIAIEQNPDKPSEWGNLARQGHKVVQVKDLSTDRYVAVVVDGRVKEY